MNEKQQQLIFDKGITNVPSDYICPDNALENAYNLIYNNGQHQVIQKPATFISSAVDDATPLPNELEGFTLLYVHHFNDNERYIAYYESAGEGGAILYPIIWGEIQGNVFKQKGGFADSQPLYFSEGVKVTSVGKTIIIANEEGLHYFLWKPSSYLSLGTSIPRPEVEFKMDLFYDATEEVRCDGIVGYNVGIDINQKIIFDQVAWNDCAIGLYSKLRKKVWRKRAFHGSFMVRPAIELYDGTFYYIGNPILMVNVFHAYGVAKYIPDGQRENKRGTVRMFVEGTYLFYKWSQDYSNWSDIVKGVVLFVTKEANVLDTTGDAIFQDPTSAIENDPWFYKMEDNEIEADGRSLSDEYSTLVLPSIDDTGIKSIVEDGVFYKLANIGLKGDGQWNNAGKHFEDHTIENITTQTQLGEDDFFSHCPIQAKLLYPYNSRLNLASVKRGFFEGFDNFMPFTTPFGGNENDEATYTFFVTIRTDEGDKVVSHQKTTNQIQGIYFYYPDPRATHVFIKKGNTVILNKNLTEHPTLHGAYYFAVVEPGMVEPTISGTQPDTPVPTSNAFELLPNYIITSEVNNPFVFKAEGYNKVGTGKIIGLATTTMALSQDAYGRTDLMVFSESGIWGMAVDRTGLFSSIHPFSREVCNNAKSITQTDGAIFFSSDKGLMIATDAGVKCVSTQLSGKSTEPFCEYLKSSFMAYDYRDSLLWIFNEPSNNSNTYYYYIYAIKTGAFSKVQLPNLVKGVVSDYPDSLVQDTSQVGSMTKRLDINSDTDTYSALLVSRPLKLENAIALKSIMQAKHVFDTATATLSWTVQASNNAKTWVQLTSLRGIPWKYYRFTYSFTNLKPTDAFSGTILITQERRTNRMR